MRSKLIPHILAAVLADVALARAQAPVAVPFTEANLDAAPVLRPTSVLTTRGSAVPVSLYVRGGFRKMPPDYSLGAGEDPNPIYRRARPYPELGLEGLSPISIGEGAGPSNCGVRAVEASSLRWPWPPPDPRGLPESERIVRWRWEAPAPLQRNWWAFAGCNGVDRYIVMCLYTKGMEPDAPAPQLFYFDALNGLRWHTRLPVDRSLEIPPPSGFQGEAEVLLGIRSDGGRILALVTRPNWRGSLLYVFASSGRLLRILSFPDRYALLGLSPSWELPRSPSGHLFLLSLQHRAPVSAGRRGGLAGRPAPPIAEPYIPPTNESYIPPTNESYIIDPEGDILARLVDERDQPMQGRLLSDTHVLALKVGGRVKPDAEPDYLHYLYSVPASVSQTKVEKEGSRDGSRR